MRKLDTTQHRCKSKTAHFKQLVCKLASKAYFRVVYFAQAVMRASNGYEVESSEGSCGTISGVFCTVAERDACYSPVSIYNALGDATDATDATNSKLRSALPHCTRILYLVYGELVYRNLWNTRFHSGGGTGLQGDPTTVRSLATRHLKHPSTDGWNVVAGATALAQTWALAAADIPLELGECFEFNKEARLRMAVCLCVAWKFERCFFSHFPRHFHTKGPSLLSPHTHELAFVGYAFLTAEEQDCFGPWEQSNAANVRSLYHAMASLEVKLLCEANVMAFMTRNIHVLAEHRIATLLDRHVVGDNSAMAMRAILPLFTIASQDGRNAPPSTGALVCAAMLCISVTTPTTSALVVHHPETMRELFTERERHGAYNVVCQVAYPRGTAVDTIQSSCYCDKNWVHYPFVCADALRIAIGFATALF